MDIKVVQYLVKAALDLLDDGSGLRAVELYKKLCIWLLPYTCYLYWDQKSVLLNRSISMCFLNRLKRRCSQ